MRSNMPAQKDFSKNPTVSKQRSVFNRSHAHKSTFNVDQLIPFYADEILPGDSQDVKANIFARLSATLSFPIMDNIFIDTFFFYVPNRILWEHWEEFMGANPNAPAPPTVYQIPQVTGTPLVGDLSDYLGIPPGNDMSVSSLWHRAYIKIYNDWFRDENLITPIGENTGDGPETIAAYPLLLRGKRHDYFTSCLPQPQKGDPVSIALSGILPVFGDGNSLGFTEGTSNFSFYTGAGGNARAQADQDLFGTSLGTAIVSPDEPDVNSVSIGIVESGASGLQVNLGTANAISINDFRLAVATQQLLELDNRGGTRYFEILQAHFGVQSPDSRLQRPEYLGGSTNMININPVTQTSRTRDDLGGASPQGHQAAFVTGSSRSGYSKSFVEHGVIIGLVNVRADLTYQQGINRMFSRLDRYDFYFPTFANLGEQAVLNKEIFYNDDANDDLVFGYNEHWSEMRYKPSMITARFRSDAADTLDAWHLSIDFASVPVLNASFINAGLYTPLNRTMAAPGTATVPQIIFDSYIEIKHARCMPTYSIPGLKRL